MGGYGAPQFHFPIHPLIQYVKKEALLQKRGKEGNTLFNNALTHFIYGYMVSDIW